MFNPSYVLDLHYKSWKRDKNKYFINFRQHHGCIKKCSKTFVFEV